MPHPMRHAHQRAKERYGVDLLPEELERMVVEIVQGRSRPIRRASGGHLLHLVHCPKAATDVPVVFDPFRNVIVTVLPPEAKTYAPVKKRRPPRCENEPMEMFGAEPCEGELPHENPANNALADALERALCEAGLVAPLAQSSPSKG